MKYVVIFGSEIKTKDDLFAAFEKHLDLPEYSGKNLDALHDSLGGMKLTLEIKDTKKLTENLGDYGDMLLCMLRDLDDEFESVKIIEN
ncbi:MAG: barnase inhibitor [Ruminococcaceae bacterium]|nr:barnase inhibitor [Oscillospiraceae bacterium]